MTDSYEIFYEKITEECLEQIRNPPCDLTWFITRLMKLEDFPMHAPVHHYLVPAVLLTFCRQAQGHGRAVLERDLALALERAKSVPGGSCGFYGACGACIGVGIFWSIIMDATPLSTQSWSCCNQATGEALLAIASVGGPRCCKRCTYLSIMSTVPRLQRVLGLEVSANTPICRFHEQNEECLNANCPYFPGKEIRIPVFAYPKKDLDHPCPCQDRPVELTHKRGKIFWQKDEGEFVAADEIVAELEVEKKSLQIPAPTAGILSLRCFTDGDEVDMKDILGYIRYI